MANWWDEDETVSVGAAPAAPAPSGVQPQTDNWWDEDETVEASPTPVAPVEAPEEEGELSFGDYVNRLSQPEELQGEIDTRNDHRTAETSAITAPVENLTKSNSELYDSIRNDPKYQKLNEYENSLSQTIGPNLTTRNQQTGESAKYNLWTGAEPDDIKLLRQQREAELDRAYRNQGEKAVLPTPLGASEIRVQPIVTPNPDFDPNKPVGPENPSEVTQKYMLDPPDREAFTRMAYQVARNIGAGVVDFVHDGVTKGELNLTADGEMGKVLPNTIPDMTGEKFATDVTTFVLGPKIITGTIKEAAVLGNAGAVSLAGKIGSMLSPETRATAQQIYQSAINGGKSAQEAFKASNQYLQKAVVGAAIGVESAVVAPSNSEGMIPPETIRKYMPSLSKESARDVSFLLDTPVVGTTLTSLGAITNKAKEKLIAPALGGLRNVQAFGLSGNRLIGMSEKAVGFKTALWLDPNLKGASPELLTSRLQMLDAAFKNNAVRNAKLAGAGKQIDLDSTTAFTEMSEGYFRMAYSNLKDQMEAKAPGSFDKWVKDQANESSARLVELRTKSMGDTTISTKVGKIHSSLEDLINDGADSLTPNGMVDAQMRAAQTMAGDSLGKIDKANADLMVAETERDTAQKLAKNAITDDGEFSLFLSEHKSPLGSERMANNSVNKASDKTYKALTHLKKETDDAYQRIADTGAQGDPSSFLAIIHGTKPKAPAGLDDALRNDPEARALYEKLGPTRQAAEAQTSGTEGIKDKFLKDLADRVTEDPSIGNLYNNVRNDISDRIARLLKAGTPDQDALDTLYALRKNIEDTQLDYAVTQNPELEGMVKEAKEKFLTFHTAFNDHDELSRITDTGLKRMQSDPAFESNTPVSPIDGRPQNVTNYKIKLSRHIRNALEGKEGELFTDSLTRATKIGGQDITPELNDFYATRALTKLSKMISRKQPQDVNTLQQSLEGIIEPMQQLGSPMVKKYEDLMLKVQKLHDNAGDKDALYQQVAEDAQKLKDEATSSLFYRFVYDGKAPKDASAAGIEMKRMFNSPERVNKMKDLMGKAEAMGKGGESIKEALKSTYLDNMADRLISKRATGLTGIEDGVLETGYKINETNYKKIFKEGSPDMEVMKVIYKDNPEVIDNLSELSKLYVNSSKTTPHAKDTLGGGAVSPEMDPQRGINTAINLLMGQLSRGGARLKAVTGPMGVKDMNTVAEANAAAVTAFLVDPVEASRLIGMARKGIIDKRMGADFNALLMRATFRGIAQEKKDLMKDEMGRLK